MLKKRLLTEEEINKYLALKDQDKDKQAQKYLESLQDDLIKTKKKV